MLSALTEPAAPEAHLSPAADSALLGKAFPFALEEEAGKSGGPRSSLPWTVGVCGCLCASPSVTGSVCVSDVYQHGCAFLVCACLLFGAESLVWVFYVSFYVRACPGGLWASVSLFPMCMCVCVWSVGGGGVSG